MRLLKVAALLAATALAGCVDVDMTTTITGPDQAQVAGYMEVQRQTVEMMGGATSFCSAEEGGTLTMGDTVARCDVLMEGSFAEVFEGSDNEPTPSAEDLGDGTVRVTFPLGAMTADAAEMRNNPQSAAMVRPMLEGHTFTLRVAGAEIVSTNGTMADDGASASYVFRLVDVLDASVQMPEFFETIVRY